MNPNNETPKETISFVISSDFGIFRKPEIVDVGLTYEIIPKPTLLGILGAIMGFKGLTHPTEEDDLEYYEKLHNLKVGIIPLEHQKKTFKKRTTPIKKIFLNFNNVHSFGNTDGNWILKEQLLLNPVFRIFICQGGCEKNLFLDLKEKILKRQFEFYPYMGKNEFPITLSNPKVITPNRIDVNPVKLDSIIFKEVIKREVLQKSPKSKPTEIFRIKLNYPFELQSFQYRYKETILTNLSLDIDQTKVDKCGGNLIEADGNKIFIF